MSETHMEQSPVGLVSDLNREAVGSCNAPSGAVPQPHQVHSLPGANKLGLGRDDSNGTLSQSKTGTSITLKPSFRGSVDECAKLRMITGRDRANMNNHLVKLQHLMIRCQGTFDVSEMDEIKLSNTKPELFDSNRKLRVRLMQDGERPWKIRRTRMLGL